MKQEKSTSIHKPTVSIVISARNEFPQIAMTIHSLINDLELAGYGADVAPNQFEIIIVDNGSDDRTTEFFTYSKSNTTPSGLQYSPRGMVTNGYLRHTFDPVMGNVSARNVGAKMARGKYLFFCDGHISVRPGTFKHMIDALDTYGGIVHPVIEWMGAYPVKGGHQYSLKLGEKFWGTWNRLKVSDDPFYIPMSGHCFLGIHREEFLDFHGYNDHFRVYGGGETYLDLKWWMFGKSSMTVPKAVVYHLSAGRGYSYKMDDLVHNMALSAYLIGGMKWWERILITYLDKKGSNKRVVHELCDQGLVEGKEDREFILSRTKIPFEDVIKDKPWDTRNDKLHGKHLSAMVIFEDWLDRLKDPEAIEIYQNSEYQK